MNFYHCTFNYMNLTTSDIIKCIITTISAIDFVVFTVFFIGFLTIIPFKSKDMSTRFLALIIIVLFVIYKAMHIPMFLSTISVFKYTFSFGYISIGILTYVNLILAAFPLWLAIYTSYIQVRISSVDLASFDKNSIKIIMPIYNEDPDVLYNAVLSVINLKYNKNILHLYLSFDDDTDSDAYLFIMKKFGLINENGEYLV